MWARAAVEFEGSQTSKLGGCGRVRASTFCEKESQMERKKNWFTSEQGSRLRKAQIAAEVAMAKKLETEGFKVFSPTVVCDRVAVKDGKVFFVEFKKAGQELRPGQQEIHDLVPEMYLIRYE